MARADLAVLKMIAGDPKVGVDLLPVGEVKDLKHPDWQRSYAACVRAIASARAGQKEAAKGALAIFDEIGKVANHQDFVLVLSLIARLEASR